MTETMANKSKYESHVLPKLELIEAWSRDGLTLEQIAHNLGVACSTFRRYKDEPDKQALAAALARGREICDIEVENALHKKAIGYNAKIIKHYKVKRIEYDPDTGKKVAEYEELVEAQDEVHVPADTEAAKWWLSNRDRNGKWRYKPEPVATGEDGETGVIEIGGQMEEPQPPEALVEQMMAEAVGADG